MSNMIFRTDTANIFDQRENASRPRRDIDFINVPQKQGPDPVTEYFGRQGKPVETSKTALAKRITLHSGTSQYFVRQHGGGTYSGLLVDPYDHLIGKNLDATANDGSGPVFPFISVTETPNLYYVDFLKSHNSTSFNEAQRLVRGSL